MTEMFGLLKELITSRTPEKVLIREEAKFPITKNVNSISLANGEEDMSDKIDVATGNDIEKPTETEMRMQSKISFHRIPESLCKIKRGVKNTIDPIAHTMTVNRLVLEWEERIKVHLEREMKFDQWKRNFFNSKHPALVKVEGKMDDEGEVM
nr:hypothetical protein [Tanacetum cinerariifolium]